MINRTGESDEHIISSIINLVCPECGGCMLEFQCNGRCRRNWFSVWNERNAAADPQADGQQRNLRSRQKSSNARLI